MKPHRQIFAHFFSPGTLFAETTLRPLETGTLEEAVTVAKSITERYNARPYGFDLVTMLVAEPVDDGEGGKMEVPPKEVERTGRHFLGGDIVLYEEAVSEAGEGSIWATNMRGNRDPICVVITNGFKSTQVFREKDCIVDPETGAVLKRGNDPELVKYRATKIDEWNSEEK